MVDIGEEPRVLFSCSGHVHLEGKGSDSRGFSDKWQTDFQSSQSSCCAASAGAASVNKCKHPTQGSREGNRWISAGVVKVLQACRVAQTHKHSDMSASQHCGMGSSLVPPWTEGNMKLSSSLFLALLQNVPECKLEKHFCFHEKETIPTLGTVAG